MSFEPGVEFHAFKDPYRYRSGVSLTVYRVGRDASDKPTAERLLPDSSDRTGQAYQFRDVGFFAVPEPTFDMSMERAQALMDQLWQCGLRPTEGEGSAGALSAVKSHRDDLRTLLFKQMGVAE